MSRKPRTTGPKLRCPACGHAVSVVLPDKHAGQAHENGEDVYRRVRECQACRAQFSSVERVERLLQRQSAA